MIVVGVVILLCAGLLGPVLMQLPEIRRNAWRNVAIRGYEKRNGVSPSVIHVPTNDQPWKVFQDPGGTCQVELKGIVVGGQGRTNGVPWRELHAYDPATEQDANVTVYLLPPKCQQDPALARQLIEETIDGFVAGTASTPISVAGLNGLERRGQSKLGNGIPAVHRILLREKEYIDLSATAHNGPLSEADVQRFFNSFKLLK